MTPEIQDVTHVVKDVSNFWPIVITFVSTLGTLLAGLVPYLQYRDKKIKEQHQKEIQDEKNRQAEYPSFLKDEDFRRFKSSDYEVFKTRVLQNQDDLGRIVKSAAIEASNASVAVQNTAEKIKEDQGKFAKELRESQDSNAREIRESFGMLMTAVNTSLGSVHEKANEAQIKVATFEGRIQALEVKDGIRAAS